MGTKITNALLVVGMVMIWSCVAFAAGYGLYYNIKYPAALSTEPRPVPKKV